MFSIINLKSCFMIILGSCILAFGLYNIHSFSGVTEGGILGLTLLLQHHLNISPAVTSLILSLICYCFGCMVLDKGFIFYSIIASVGYSAFYKLCELIGPLFKNIGSMPLLASLLGALFVGIGIGLCVRAGGAPGGDDALAMSLAHITGKKLQSFYLMLDLAVLVLSLSYISASKMVYSLITVIISGQIIGFISDFDFDKLKTKLIG